ncbi:MAG: hypothetical protein Q9160_009324 [Pyrenula sp. 1 TL-2023]
MDSESKFDPDESSADKEAYIAAVGLSTINTSNDFLVKTDLGDGGATAYMTDQIKVFTTDPTGNESGKRKVKVGGGSLAIRGKGMVNLSLPRSLTKLQDVLDILKLSIFYLQIYVVRLNQPNIEETGPTRDSITKQLFNYKKRAELQTKRKLKNYAVNHAIYIKNLLPGGLDMVREDGIKVRQSPQLAWSGILPDINKLRV